MDVNVILLLTLTLEHFAVLCIFLLSYLDFAFLLMYFISILCMKC